MSPEVHQHIHTHRISKLRSQLSTDTRGTPLGSSGGPLASEGRETEMRASLGGRTSSGPASTQIYHAERQPPQRSSGWREEGAALILGPKCCSRAGALCRVW